LWPLPDNPPARTLPIFDAVMELWGFREDMIYLSPAPLYHAAPLLGVSLTIGKGGTAIIMEHFDPEQYLALIERRRVTHTQLVPTMFSRMLKLSDEVRCRYDLSSLEIAIHAAAPCPVPVKEQMIEWWGPIILEYYSATEGHGLSLCDSAEWLAHRGTVGRVLLGELHVLDDAMQPVPTGTPGTLWFKTASQFEYFKDPEKTKEARSQDGTMSTIGDVGYVDEDGYVYLRKNYRGFRPASSTSACSVTGIGANGRAVSSEMEPPVFSLPQGVADTGTKSGAISRCTG
jgi:long-chain acyl-CoA synthetase